MSPAQWSTVENLFQAALDLGPEQREEFVRSACSDPEILREVQSLLQSVKEDDFLNSPAIQTAREAIETAVHSRVAADSQSTSDGGLAFIGALAGNRYRLVQVLARGAHGLVFIAADSRLAERKVVVKILDGAAEHQRWLQRRFQQEITILGRISHPAVAGIRDCGVLQGRPYLVMDFIEGVTLREHMKSGLTTQSAAAIVAQIGSALRAAHVQGIVHRDLKPENVMVQPTAHDPSVNVSVKLIDFGIAHMQRAELGGTTTVLMIAGTPRYMAPEQFLGHADGACDIYSLAVVCFEMLAGATPYDSSDALTLASAQRSTPPEFVLDHNDKIPVYVRPFLASGLAVDPQRRPGDAEAFGHALRDALLRPAPGWISRVRLRFSRDVHSRILAISLLILLAAAALASAAWVQSMTHIQRSLMASGLNNPSAEGFSTHLDVTGRVELTGDGRGIEAWSLFTRSQGFYFHGLTWQQKRIAMSHGWRLIGAARLQEGALYLGADFRGAGPRFATGATLDGNALILRAWTDQASSEWQSLSAPIPGDPHAYHTYELLFDPKPRTLAIKVDGIERIRGYAGLRQFQERLGLAFGAHRWKSTTARADFRSVRLDILP
jgi:serine/threonine protein kinase